MKDKNRENSVRANPANSSCVRFDSKVEIKHFQSSRSTYSDSCRFRNLLSFSLWILDRRLECCSTLLLTSTINAQVLEFQKLFVPSVQRFASSRAESHTSILYRWTNGITFRTISSGFNKCPREACRESSFRDTGN